MEKSVLFWEDKSGMTVLMLTVTTASVDEILMTHSDFGLP
jgi:hypothetical protein